MSLIYQIQYELWIGFVVYRLNWYLISIRPHGKSFVIVINGIYYWKNILLWTISYVIVLLFSNCLLFALILNYFVKIKLRLRYRMVSRVPRINTESKDGFILTEKDYLTTRVNPLTQIINIYKKWFKLGVWLSQWNFLENWGSQIIYSASE